MSGPVVVIPNPRIPSVVGTLNIVFGILLLLAGLGTVGWTLAYPHLRKAAVGASKSEQERAKRVAEIDTKLADLNKKLAAEKDFAVRERLRDEIGELQDERDENEFDVTDLETQNMKDPRVAVPFWANHLLGILLNALMITSGVGLVALRAWGRKLALQVAAVKLVKLAIMTIVAVGLTIPLQVVRTRQLWAKLEARSGSAGPMGTSMSVQMTQFAAVYATVVAVGFGVTGMIYPALSLWLLSKPSVRAAFASRKPGPPGEAAGTGPSDLS